MAGDGRPRVVIIGAGFGGLWAARALTKAPADILLVDRDNYHTFLPLLYQVSAAELEPEEIAYPIRAILRQLPNTRFVMGDVTDIELTERAVKVDGDSISYDYLVLAMGSTSNYFGVPGAAENSFSLKTLEEGTALRNHILCCFEQASFETDDKRRRRLLTFIIVGGGATGVEFAGALAELIDRPLVRDYPSLDFKEVQIILIEAADNLLTMLPQKLRSYAHERLAGMGVKIRLQTMVNQINADSVILKSGETIPTETVVWTAGVGGQPIVKSWGLPTARDGRVKVLPTLQVPDRPEVYVIGDLAYFEENGRPLPMVAPVAVQQGGLAAQNIVNQISGQPLREFRYHDRGTMVTIGRNAGVVRIGERVFTGLLAWMLWLGVHLLNLIGFRNRLLVMINWSQDYFLFERAVRFIFPSEKTLFARALRCSTAKRAGDSDESRQS